MTQRTFGFRKTILAILIMLFLSGSSWALKPEVDSFGHVILRVEHPHDGLRICYTAVALGAEMWWWRYNAHIVKYCTPNSPPFYATLPGYGYTRVDAAKLARMLTLDPELAPRGFTTTLRDKLVTAMQNDRRSGPKKQVGDYWDPTNDWKWRSVYMKNRMSNPVKRGNCFGAADYMTKGWEWTRDYVNTSAQHYSFFPYIYLDGFHDCCVSYFDHELQGPDFVYVDDHHPGMLVGYYLNCFDILRFSDGSDEIQPTDLIITTPWNTQLNLGTPYHAEAYLLSDRSCKTWCFLQIGQNRPYGVFQSSNPAIFLCTYFFHKYRAKEVITSILKENWANVPVNQ